MKISEQSTSSHPGEGQLPQPPGGSVATRAKLSLPAIVASRFGKFDIGLRARLLGRLLASVGPLALKVVGGGVFAKYVRHARSPGIPVSFEDAVRTTSTQVCDLVHYVEQSNPNLVEELSTALSLNDHCDQRPRETQRPSRRIVDQQTLTHDAPNTSRSAPRIECEDPPPGRGFHRRELHDY
jgi:hypothetical protein